MDEPAAKVETPPVAGGKPAGASWATVARRGAPGGAAVAGDVTAVTKDSPPSAGPPGGRASPDTPSSDTAAKTEPPASVATSQPPVEKAAAERAEPDQLPQSPVAAPAAPLVAKAAKPAWNKPAAPAGDVAAVTVAAGTHLWPSLSDTKDPKTSATPGDADTQTQPAGGVAAGEAPPKVCLPLAPALLATPRSLCFPKASRISSRLCWFRAWGASWRASQPPAHSAVHSLAVLPASCRLCWFPFLCRWQHRWRLTPPRRLPRLLPATTHPAGAQQMPAPRSHLAASGMAAVGMTAAAALATGGLLARRKAGAGVAPVVRVVLPTATWRLAPDAAGAHAARARLVAAWGPTAGEGETAAQATGPATRHLPTADAAAWALAHATAAVVA